MSLDGSCNVCENVIYQSGDTPLNFSIENCDGSPFNLTGATEIVAIFQTSSLPPVVLKLSLDDITVVNAGGGQFSCLMVQANALLLTVGLINVEVRITLGGQVNVTELIGQLTVTPSLFPSVSN